MRKRMSARGTRGLGCSERCGWRAAQSGPNYVKPEVPAAEKFEGAVLANVSRAKPRSRSSGRSSTTRRSTSWSTRSLAANHDLRIALARFSEARAARGESRFDLAPTITAGGGYTEQRRTR